MASLLNSVIYIGPIVFLLGLVAAITCLLLRLSTIGKSKVLHWILKVTGIGIAGFVVGTGVGIAFFCSTASTGNLCGLGGVFGIGPLIAGLSMFCYGVLTYRKRK